MHYVYILSTPQAKTYIGYSSNLKRRLIEHVNGKAKHTSTLHDAKMVWYCCFTSKKKALDFERYLKHGSGHAFAKRHLV